MRPLAVVFAVDAWHSTWHRPPCLRYMVGCLRQMQRPQRLACLLCWHSARLSASAGATISVVWRNN